MINLVVQIGTGYSKIGYSGQANPRVITESYLVEQESRLNTFQQQIFQRTHIHQYASNIDTSRKDINIKRIFNNQYIQPQYSLGLKGISINQSFYLKFIEDAINEMKNTSLEMQIFIVQSSHLKKYQAKSIRQKIIKFIFQQTNVNSIYFMKSSVTNCFSQGVSSGIVVDSGHNFTSLSQVVDSYQQKTKTFNFGGNILNYQIQKYLKDTHKNDFPWLVDKQNVYQQLLRQKYLKNIKHRLFNIQNKDIEDQNQINIELPDGQNIIINKNKINQPFTVKQHQYKNNNHFSFFNYFKGLASQIKQFSKDYKSKIGQIKKPLILTGGNFFYNDIYKKTSDQILRQNQNINLKLLNTQRRNTSSWIGGSIVSNISSFSNYWITSKQYKQNGYDIVIKKCP